MPALCDLFPTRTRSRMLPSMVQPFLRRRLAMFDGAVFLRTGSWQPQNLNKNWRGTALRLFGGRAAHAPN